MTDGDATETELAVVGGGPGGYAAAIRAGQLGVDVTLIERDAYGGVCLNSGCIPSKALVSAADLVHRAGNAEVMGIHAAPEVDLETLAGWKDDVVANMSRAVEKLCKANGVTLLPGTARFVDDRQLRVEPTEGGESERVSFERAIVATGSRSIELPGLPFADERVLDAAGVLALDELPERLVVVGAGYIGMELSAALAKLGSEVVVLEALDEILPGYDRDLARPVRKRAGELGIELHTGHAVTGYEETGTGVAVTADAETDGGGARETQFAGDAVLVAVGREPTPETVDPGAAGLEPDADGFLATDEVAETAVPGIYAVGDVSGEPLLAHQASREGVVAAATIADDLGATDGASAETGTLADGVVPAAVFTDPEIGTVGHTETSAREAEYEPDVGEFPFRASGRALTADEPEGFVRLVAEEKSGTVLGGQVVGPEASELIAEVGLAVETGATIEDVAATIHAHPTLGEGVHEAAENALGLAIHTLNR